VFKLDFFRPFLVSAIRAGSIALGLTKWFVFNSRFLAMAKLAQARLCPFGLAKTLNFFRPFPASAIRAGSIALGLTKWFVFNSRFLAMAKLAQARLCPFGLAKTLGCRSNKWVEE